MKYKNNKKEPYEQHNPKIVSVILFCGEIFYIFFYRVTCGNNNLLFLSGIVSIEIKNYPSIIPDHCENLLFEMYYMFVKFYAYEHIFPSCLLMSNANHKNTL